MNVKPGGTHRVPNKVEMRYSQSHFKCLYISYVCMLLHMTVDIFNHFLNSIFG